MILSALHLNEGPSVASTWGSLFIITQAPTSTHHIAHKILSRLAKNTPTALLKLSLPAPPTHTHRSIAPDRPSQERDSTKELWCERLK